MKSFVALLAVVAVVAADVSHVVSNGEANAQILEQHDEVYPDKYDYSFKTSNGISAVENGILTNAGREDEAIEVQGQNQYTAPDGKVITVTYIANANGYQAQGDHLPTPPPTQAIPDYILRSLEYIAAHPQKPELQRP